MDKPQASDIEALRLGAALSEMPHVSALRVTGEDAFDALDMLVPAEMFIRDGQMLHSLLLDPDGEPLADIYVCRDDEDFFLLAEGMTGCQIIEYANEHLPSELDVSWEDLNETHEVHSLGGPYCWEVLAEWMGPDIIGIPYLTFFRIEGEGLVDGVPDWTPIGLCFRAGKTGEYGYDMLIEKEHVAAMRNRLFEVGEPLGLARGGLAALDQCALENGFFNVRAASWTGLTPIELQLQWRVSYRKQHVGAQALIKRRAKGPDRRLAHFLTPSRVTPGDDVTWRGERVGTIHVVGYSSIREQWVGQVLLKRRLSHAGIDKFQVHHRDEPVPLATVSAPVINNRSLYVDPRRHSVRFRDEEVFPPLVVGADRAMKESGDVG